MRSPRGFMKPARRGSAYRSVTGTHWIKKFGSKWHLIQMGDSPEGVKPITVAEFTTLAEAARFYLETNHTNHLKHAWGLDTK
jgi:hypothetical protein